MIKNALSPPLHRNLPHPPRWSRAPPPLRSSREYCSRPRSGMMASCRGWWSAWCWWAAAPPRWPAQPWWFCLYSAPDQGGKVQSGGVRSSVIPLCRDVCWALLSHHVGDVFNALSDSRVWSTDAELQGQLVSHRHLVGPRGDVQIVLLESAKGEEGMNGDVLPGLLLWGQISPDSLSLSQTERKHELQLIAPDPQRGRRKQPYWRWLSVVAGFWACWWWPGRLRQRPSGASPGDSLWLGRYALGSRPGCSLGSAKKTQTYVVWFAQNRKPSTPVVLTVKSKGWSGLKYFIVSLKDTT